MKRTAGSKIRAAVLVWFAAGLLASSLPASRVALSTYRSRLRLSGPADGEHPVRRP